MDGRDMCGRQAKHMQWFRDLLWTGWKLFKRIRTPARVGPVEGLGGATAGVPIQPVVLGVYGTSCWIDTSGIHDGRDYPTIVPTVVSAIGNV